MRVGGLLPAAAVSVLLVGAVSGCSSTASAPPSAPASVAVTPEVVEREAVRGEKVLVPESWRMTTEDGGGSGSYSIWVDPHDPEQWVAVSGGVEAGAWCGVDGVSGSVDPTAMLPKSAAIEQVSRGTFTYSYPGVEFAAPVAVRPEPPKAPGEVRGVWIGSPECDGYVSPAYSLPGWPEGTVAEIVRAFERDNALS